MGKGIYSAQWGGKITHFTTGQQRIHKEQQESIRNKKDLHHKWDYYGAQVQTLWESLQGRIQKKQA